MRASRDEAAWWDNPGTPNRKTYKVRVENMEGLEGFPGQRTNIADKNLSGKGCEFW